LALRLALDFDQDKPARRQHQQVDLVHTALVVDELEIRARPPRVAVAQVLAPRNSSASRFQGNEDSVTDVQRSDRMYFRRAARLADHTQHRAELNGALLSGILQYRTSE
jgi:hypothetical protein